MRTSERGNAVLFILLAVALFAGLAYTFMRGAKTGQGNMSAGQTKIVAQDMADYFAAISRAVSRLRQKGCSENDINFAYPSATAVFIAANKPGTTPVDGSCDVFSVNGGNVTQEPNYKTYQVPASVMPDAGQHGNIYFRMSNIAITGIESAGNELMMNFNFVKPEICKEYHRLIDPKLDMSIADSVPVYGNDNTTLASHLTACMTNGVTLTNGQPAYQIYYVWVGH